MNKSISWLRLIVLTSAILIVSYGITRGEPRSGDPNMQSAKLEKKTESSRGIASYYGVKTNGTRTASGIPLNDSLSTAAHRTLPFGTLVRVTNLSNGSHETVKITDRGPFIKGRIIDVSRNAAEKLGMLKAGVTSVEIEVLPGVLKTPRASWGDRRRLWRTLFPL